MRRASVVVLAAAGPLAVALLRLVLPYYQASNNTEAAADVVAHPGTESLVLWLGLVAGLTLVPGLYAIRHRVPAGKLSSAGFTLATIGYLCLPGLFATDLVLWLGADQGLPIATTADLADGLHPATFVAVVLFVPTHILGIVLIGLVALRHRMLPQGIAWGLMLSQPMHLASVILGLPVLDCFAWSVTALGMAWLAATLPDINGTAAEGAPTTTVVEERAPARISKAPEPSSRPVPNAG